MKEKIDMSKGIRIEVIFGCAFALALIIMLLAFSFYEKRPVRVDAKPADTIAVALAEKSGVASTSSASVATQENFVTNDQHIILDKGASFVMMHPSRTQMVAVSESEILSARKTKK